jgi:outer membrane protein OmpA-like peptidoglycan-associated protein
MNKYLLLLLLAGSSMLATAQGTLQIRGSFYDDSTGIDLPTQIYSYTNGKKKHLGQSNRVGMFEFRYDVTVALDADSLGFESAGYTTVTVPFHNQNEMKGNYTATLGVRTLKEGKKVKPFYYRGLLMPKDSTVRYKYIDQHVFAEGESLAQDFTFHVNSIHGWYENTNTPHVISVTSGTEVLAKIYYKVEKRGITLVNLDVKPEAANGMDQVAIESNPPVPFQIKDVFFAQSSFELNQEEKHNLGELATYLKANPTAKIALYGRTDRVGNPELNVTLARYRAAVVFKYLQELGVNPIQTQASWEGINRKPVSSDSSLSDFRKVSLREF